MKGVHDIGVGGWALGLENDGQVVKTGILNKIL